MALYDGMMQVLDTTQREAEEKETQAAEETAEDNNSHVIGASEAQDEVDARGSHTTQVSHLACVVCCMLLMISPMCVKVDRSAQLLFNCNCYWFVFIVSY